MNDQPTDNSKDTLRPSWRISVSRAIYTLVSLVAFCGLFFHMQKSARKNFDIEKSIMKPQMISDTSSSFTTHYKKYFSHNIKPNDPKSSETLFRTFESSLRLYGLNLKRQSFSHRDVQSWNAYSFIPSRKENLYRCYVYAFNRKDPWSLLTMNVILDEFFSKDGNLGLSIVLLGYDGELAGYNFSTKKFFEDLYNTDSLIPECVFARDGINIEVLEQEQVSSEIRYFPSILNSWRGRDNVRLRIFISFFRKIA
jgi:hypothetical protein